MFENIKKVNGQTVIRRSNKTPVAAVKEGRKSRYGKRFLTLRGQSIIADFLQDGTANLYVIEEGTKALLPVVKNVPRAKARATANTIAKLMESYESITQLGIMQVELLVKR